MILKQHLSDEQGFSDLLNYAHVIDDGVIVNKDGAFLVTYKFRGPDINSASSGELDALSSNFNRMLTFLDDGWMIYVDDMRIPSVTYPTAGAFPCRVAALIDEERRRLYEAEGAHYENLQFLTFVWKFPLPIIKTSRHWFIDGDDDKHGDYDLTKLLRLFLDSVERCVGLISTQLILEKLNTAALLSFLNATICGDIATVAVPPPQTFIDYALSRHNVCGGYVPKIGNKSIIILSFVGYVNRETIPGLLEEMSTYPIIYRWSNRFVPFGELTAEREIKRYQKNWNNKVKGFFGIVKEAVFGGSSDKIDVDALQMSNETTEALTANSNHSTRFGYWTSVLVLLHDKAELIEHAAKELAKYLEQAGFACIREDVNAFDAWLGSIPGHGSCNLRRVFLNSVNLAHLLPLPSIWVGTAFNAASSLLPPHSPPVFYAAATGKTPFRFHLDVADVGHQIVLGPTGAGKSTYLGFLIAQFLRYQGAQIFVFDKDYSHQALTVALDGHHYDIGNAEALSFCPLADLSTDTKKMRAVQFIESLVFLQNIKITPAIREAIARAIESLASERHAASRNITVLCSEVQHMEVRAALRYYTIDGQIKLLDAISDSLKTGHLQTFEMNWLLAQKPEIYVPILMYIFDQIEDRLEEAAGQKPTLIILEEAWLYIGHELFARKLRDWLKTLRKKNARVVFATQSLSDLYDPTTKTLTSITAAIMESCPTKVYLPNPKMEFETRELYRRMNLSDRQIELISSVGIPKKHYYVVTPYGNRLIDLGFDELTESESGSGSSGGGADRVAARGSGGGAGVPAGGGAQRDTPKPLVLSFVGLSKERSNLLLACKQKYAAEWLGHWLTFCGQEKWREEG
jgi:type IV secretion system protein TrbE